MKNENFAFWKPADGEIGIISFKEMGTKYHFVPQMEVGLFPCHFYNMTPKECPFCEWERWLASNYPFTFGL